MLVEEAVVPKALCQTDRNERWKYCVAVAISIAAIAAVAICLFIFFRRPQLTFLQNHSFLRSMYKLDAFSLFQYPIYASVFTDQSADFDQTSLNTWMSSCSKSNRQPCFETCPMDCSSVSEDFIVLNIAPPRSSPFEVFNFNFVAGTNLTEEGMEIGRSLWTGFYLISSITVRCTMISSLPLSPHDRPIAP